jgi:putative oxidoreductase
MLVRFVNNVAQRGEDFWLLLGRLLIGSLFVPSGFEKVMDLGRFATQLGGKGVPYPVVIGALAVLVEFGGGLAIVFGFKTRVVALFMICFTLIAALITHDYWTVMDAGRGNQYIHFWKNIAIIGGFFFVFVRGAGRFSLDRR